MTKTKQIQNLLTRKPDMSAADIANKLGVSRVMVYAVRNKMKTKEVAPVFVAPTDIAELPEANTRQVGGDHYLTLAIKPWEVIEKNHMGFFDGNVLTYLMRFKSKGGIQDLEKARHYLDKLIEIEHGRNA